MEHCDAIISPGCGQGQRRSLTPRRRHPCASTGPDGPIRICITNCNQLCSTRNPVIYRTRTRATHRRTPLRHRVHARLLAIIVRNLINHLRKATANRVLLASTMYILYVAFFLLLSQTIPICIPSTFTQWPCAFSTHRIFKYARAILLCLYVCVCVCIIEMDKTAHNMQIN